MPCNLLLMVTEISPDVDDILSIYLGNPDNIISVDFDNIAIAPDDILETRGRTAEIVLAYQEYIVKYLNGEYCEGYCVARVRNAPYQFSRYFNGVFKVCQQVNYQTNDFSFPSYFKVLFTGMLPLDYIEIDRNAQTITLTLVDNVWVWIDLAKEHEINYPDNYPINLPSGLLDLWKDVVTRISGIAPYHESIIHKLTNIEMVANALDSHYYIANIIYDDGVANPYGNYQFWEQTFGQQNGVENNLVNAYRSIINPELGSGILSCVKIKVFYKYDNQIHNYYVIYEAFDCRSNNVVNIFNVRQGTLHYHHADHTPVLIYVNNALRNLRLIPVGCNIINDNHDGLDFPYEQLLNEILYLPLYNNYRKIEWNNYYNEWMFSTDIFFTSFPLTEGNHKTADIVKGILTSNNFTVVADRLGCVKIISRNIISADSTILGELTDDNIIEMKEEGIYSKVDNMLSSLSIFKGWENAQKCINAFYSDLLDTYRHRVKILYDASDTFSPEDMGNCLMKKVIVNNKEYYLLGYSQDILSNKLLELDLMGE